MAATSKKHYYSVVKGRRPGIYSQWSGSGGAQEQVQGFPGAVYRGFSTREEAEHYLRTGGKESGAPVQPTLVRLPERIHPAPPALYQPDLDAGRIVVFTDGASTGNPGPGGYGVVVLAGDKRRELSGGFRCTTNNRMELMAVIVGLQALKTTAPVVVYSDSRYVVNGITLGWARRWRSRGWMRDARNRAENADLWALLLDLLGKCEATFHWVRGHASNPENERCDQLAVQASRKKSLPDDPGFDGAC